MLESLTHRNTAPQRQPTPQVARNIRPLADAPSSAAERKSGQAAVPADDILPRTSGGSGFENAAFMLEVYKIALPLQVQGLQRLSETFGRPATLRLGPHCQIPSWIVEGAVGALVGAAAVQLGADDSRPPADTALLTATCGVMGSLGMVLAAGLVRRGRELLAFRREINEAITTLRHLRDAAAISNRHAQSASS